MALYPDTVNRDKAEAGHLTYLGSRNAAVLALDDVVDLENPVFTCQLKSRIAEKGPDALTECLKLLLRLPDFAHSQLTLRMKGDVIVKPVRGEFTGLLEQADDFLVLLRSRRRRGP